MINTDYDNKDKYNMLSDTIYEKIHSAEEIYNLTKNGPDEKINMSKSQKSDERYKEKSEKSEEKSEERNKEELEKGEERNKEVEKSEERNKELEKSEERNKEESENNGEIDILENYETIRELFGLRFESYNDKLDEDMIKYYVINEKKYMVNVEYMEKQSDINVTMRKILVDWLVDVASKFKFKTRTLYLSVNIIDRFLSKKNVARGKLQLVGICGIMIAAKYEEIYIPNVSEFVIISANAYTIDELLRMERVMLNVIDFNMGVITIPILLSCYNKYMDLNTNVKFLSEYICEVSILELDYVKYTPSTIIKSSLILSIIIDKISSYTSPQNKYKLNFTNYNDLSDCITFLYTCAISQTNAKLTAIRKKYCSFRRNEVAKLVAKISKLIEI